MLARGPRNAPIRQQTLAGAIDWSYNLLDPDEQALFARLGVFVGGWTLEAATAVMSSKFRVISEEADQLNTQNSELKTLEGLASLVDKSIVVRREQGPGLSQDESGELRFTMLETIREYALERLAAHGDEDETRRKHMQYYLGLCEVVEPHLFNQDRRVWQRRLAQEQDNLRAALRWSLSGASERTFALRLANALGRFWFLQGHFSEGRAWFEAALSDPAGPPPLRAQALTHLGGLLDALGNFQAALECFEASLAIFRAQDDRAGIARTLDQMSHVALLQGDYERATALAAESLVFFRQLDDRWHIALALERMGAAAAEQGLHDQATKLLEECIDIARQIDEMGILTSSLNILGMTELERGNSQESLALFQESLAIVQQLDQKQGLAWTLRNLGLARLATGAIADAAAHFREALSLYRELESKDGLATALEGLSGVAAAQHQPGRCARLLGAAAAIREALGMPLSPNSQTIYNRMLEAAKTQLAPAEWEAELARGRAMSLEQAIAHATAE
jgi:tetratricopeptide (TPR) repeat protein